MFRNVTPMFSPGENLGRGSFAAYASQQPVLPATVKTDRPAAHISSTLTACPGTDAKRASLVSSGAGRASARAKYAAS